MNWVHVTKVFSHCGQISQWDISVTMETKFLSNLPENMVQLSDGQIKFGQKLTYWSEKTEIFSPLQIYGNRFRRPMGKQFQGGFLDPLKIEE